MTALPPTPLQELHDVLLVDLDGTLYRGQHAVEGAPQAIALAVAAGRRIGYITNNASRSPDEVAAHLLALGYPAVAGDIVTSAQAASRLLAQRLAPGSSVFVIGSQALRAEVLGAGLTLADGALDAAAVVQGHSQETGWRQLAEGSLVIRAGALWVACNLDATLPTERGLLPGNGAMVAALRFATGHEPVVAGKPGPDLLHEAQRRTDASTPLMVGDRLDSDIAAARHAGIPSLLVLTGVSGPADALAAPVGQRPDYIAADLAALAASAATLAPGPRPGWQVTVAGHGLLLAGAGDQLDALRAMCAAHWAAGGGPALVSAANPEAAAVLHALGLADEATRSDTVGKAAPGPNRA